MPSVLRVALGRTRGELIGFFRERDAVIFIFAYPVIMLAIFATVFGQDGARVGPEPGIPFAQYFLPGMIATGVLLSSFQNLAIAIAVAGCGDGEESTAPEVVPAGGENTPTGTPGVPSGAAYDLSAGAWSELEEEERLEAAEDYVADNADICSSDGEEVPAARVADYAVAGVGTDFPLNAPVAELLAEGCAAAAQSDPG